MTRVGKIRFVWDEIRKHIRILATKSRKIPMEHRGSKCYLGFMVNNANKLWSLTSKNLLLCFWDTLEVIIVILFLKPNENDWFS